MEDIIEDIIGFIVVVSLILLTIYASILVGFTIGSAGNFVINNF